MAEITQELLKSVINYDPETGVFTWLHRPADTSGWNVRFAGKRAGYVNSKLGYEMIMIHYVNCFSHRLAWLYMTGSWPRQHTDHINGNRTDNRLCNLREATPEQNYANSKRPKTNKSGFKGVFQRGKGWQAAIRKGGKRVVLGTFPTAEEAHAAYCEAAKDRSGEFARFE